MGAFADYAQEFFDLGLQPVPIEPESKICRIYKSDIHFFKKKLTQEQLDKWIKSHGHWEIGIACGHVSGLIGIDFDYQGENWQDFERLLIGDLPPAFVIKRGKKGWTRFYRYNSNVKTTGIDKAEDGKRFVDVLSDGRVTVMPPSIHQDGMAYQYLTPDTFHDVAPDELNDITSQHIHKIKQLADGALSDIVGREIESSYDLRRNRHMTLFRKILNLATQHSDKNTIAEKLIEFDYAVHRHDEKGPYFKDDKYLKNKSPFDCAISFIDSAVKWKKKKLLEEGIDWDIGQNDLNFWIETEKGQRRSTSTADYSTFFDLFLTDARREYFTDSVYYKRHRVKSGKVEWFYSPAENHFELMQATARTAGLVPNHIKPEFYKWAEKQEAKYLIDFVPWDGKDHIKELVSHIKFKNISADHAVELFKHWLAVMWRRAENPKIQNTCILLSGGQGIGKDYFVSFMLQALRDYYSEIPISENKIENYKAVDSILVGYIPEFDESSRVPLSVIKSFITAEKAKFRASYARKSEIFQFRHSLISSANFDFLLKDSSGNRRFWVFEIDSIDWTYTNKVKPTQVLAQARHLADSGFVANKKALTKMAEIVANETPDDEKELLFLQLNDHIKEVQANINDALIGKYNTGSGPRISRHLDVSDGKVRWPMIADEVAKMARNFRISTKMAQEIMKKRGITFKDMKGPFYVFKNLENHEVLEK